MDKSYRFRRTTHYMVSNRNNKNKFQSIWLNLQLKYYVTYNCQIIKHLWLLYFDLFTMIVSFNVIGIFKTN